MLLLLAVGQASISSGISDTAGYKVLGALLISAGEWLQIILAIVFSIGSMMISSLLFQMNIVPRWLSGWGLLGSVLYFAAPFVCILGPQRLPLSFETVGLLIGPLAVQEMVFAVWMIVKGFRPSMKAVPVLG
jgi:hypothetical protein